MLSVLLFFFCEKSVLKRSRAQPLAAWIVVARSMSSNLWLPIRGVHLVVPGGTGGNQFVLTFVAGAWSAWG
jgi:hypothetical protein